MAKVYLGTYKKYNEGNLFGAWIELNQFQNYDEFIQECRRIHSDETDPEFMIQDYEDFPDGLSPKEWMDEKDFNDVLEASKDECGFNVQIIDYSEKAIAVIGDTQPIKTHLKMLGGKFNPRLSCGAGWVFSKKMQSDLETLLNCTTTQSVNSTTTPNSKSDDLELMEEYLDEYRKVWGKDQKMMDYIKKKVSKIVRLSNGGLLDFEKPRIETSFCFGYDYDSTGADNMAEHARTNEDYFMSENLSSFDNEIKNIEEGYGLYIHNERYDDDGVNIWSFKIMTNTQYINALDCKWYRQLQEANASDKKLILESLKSERVKFEKRLKSYLKKYGLSKVKSWSYWRD